MSFKGSEREGVPYFGIGDQATYCHGGKGDVLRDHRCLYGTIVHATGTPSDLRLTEMGTQTAVLLGDR